MTVQSLYGGMFSSEFNRLHFLTTFNEQMPVFRSLHSVSVLKSFQCAGKSQEGNWVHKPKPTSGSQ